jgi:hypothetical protein
VVSALAELGDASVERGSFMYDHLPQATWLERIRASARTLAVIFLTALFAAALTARWSDASATGITAFTPQSPALATGIPVSVNGTVVGAGDGKVAIVEQGAQSAVAFAVDEGASVMRKSQAVALDELRVGDSVRMTIDGLTGHALRIHATPSAPAGFLPRVPDAAALLAALGLIAGATALAVLNPGRLPSFSPHLPAMRQLHAQGAR